MVGNSRVDDLSLLTVVHRTVTVTGFLHRFDI
jgi:hypothetical protein